MAPRFALLLALLVAVGGTPALRGTAAAAAPPKPAPPTASVEHLSFGRFGQVSIYRTAAESKSVAVLLSSDAGWGKDEEAMARGLSQLDTLVIGVDSDYYSHRLERGDDTCFYPAGDLENLAKLVQKKLSQPVYLRPIVVGLGSGAALAYGSLAQAPPGTFQGAISLGMCPQQPLSRPLCTGSTAPAKPLPATAKLTPVASVEQPWMAVLSQGSEGCSAAAREFAGKVKGATIVPLPKPRPHADQVLRWMAPLKQSLIRIRNTAELARPPESAALRQLSNLPLLEMPAAGTGDTMAVVVSGDGGWTGLDRQVASALVARGMPVVALNTLQYFWTPRTPDAAGADLARVVRTYSTAWKRPQVILVGYSLGAEVLPFMAERLPPDLLENVRMVVLLGPGRTTSFEFRLSEMLGHGGGQDLPVLPELAKLGGRPVLCLYGEGEKESSLCTEKGAAVKAVDLAGGHYLGGDYHAIADQMLAELQPQAAPAQTTGTVIAGATEVMPAPQLALPKEATAKLVAEPFEYGRFGKVTLYHRTAQPGRIAILLSGDEGWTARETAIATDMTAYDTLVIGVDIRRYKSRLAVRREGCVYLAGSLELLSRTVQKRLHFPRYVRPFLSGYAEGGTLAFAALGQAPPNTFAGGMSLAFCPQLTLPSPLCTEDRLETKTLQQKDTYELVGSATIEQPWVTLTGERDTVCPVGGAFEVARHVQRAQVFSVAKIEHNFADLPAWEDGFRGSFDKLIKAPRSTASGEVDGSADLAGLPVIEMPAKAPRGDQLAIIYSGDGGWAGADREIGKVLARERGVPVVGVDGLQYLWQGKTPDAAAADLAKIVHHYLTTWKRKKAMLIGYSLGADILPFMVARLPADVRADVSLVALVGPSHSVAFEIRLTEDKASELQVLPEVKKLQGLPLVCLAAAGENDSLCPEVPPQIGRSIELPGSHGFVAQFGALADRLLEAAQPAAAKPGAPAGSQ